MKTLRFGDRGEDVKNLQIDLSVNVDGDFGPVTEKAVMGFQSAHSLVVDGIAGPKTLEALGYSKTAVAETKPVKTEVHPTGGYPAMDDPLDQCRGLDQLEGLFRAKLEAALAEAKEAGLDMLVIETYRSQLRQDHLYAQGRSRSGPVVTNTRHSRHARRTAADAVPRKNGKIDWKWKEGFKKWGAIAVKNGLAWGGNFKSIYDGPHVQDEG